MIRSLRFCAGLAWDAAEALLYSLNTNRVADVLWASARTAAAHRLVEKEASEEVAEPRCSYEAYVGDRFVGRFDDRSEAMQAAQAAHSAPAGGEAPNLPADAPQHSTSSPTAAGQPNLAPSELMDAVYAIDQLIAHSPWIRRPSHWHDLGDKLAAAARGLGYPSFPEATDRPK